MNILQSASKIVFLMVAFTACISFAMKILEAKDFMVLAMAAFSYYFAIKQPGSQNDSNEKIP